MSYWIVLIVGGMVGFWIGIEVIEICLVVEISLGSEGCLRRVEDVIWIGFLRVIVYENVIVFFFLIVV